MIIKKTLAALIFGFVFASISFAVSPQVRIKDIAHILEARDNQLMGFGLVVGLKRTGDSSQTGFTKQALTNLLGRVGVVPQANIPDNTDYKSRNVAAVMVTSTLPPFIKPGQRIDVTVSSLGDASSLQGGTLLITPLEGGNGDVYAIAQGPVLIGNTLGTHSIEFKPTPYLNQESTTVGIIPHGALVEKEVPVSMGPDKEEVSLQVMDEKGIKIVSDNSESSSRSFLTIVLEQPDFTTASRVAYSIARSGTDARAKDPSSVLVPIDEGQNIVDIVARIENLKVIPDVIAKVVINERTGTVVIGENVRIAPVAVTYGNVGVEIGDIDMYSYNYDYTDDSNSTLTRTKLKAAEKKNKLLEVSKGGTLKDLVRALNGLGATPKDLISIIQSIKAAGALTGELEII